MMSAAVKQVLRNSSRRCLTRFLTRCGAPLSSREIRLLRLTLAVFLLPLISIATLAQTPTIFPGPKPTDASPQWRHWIGEYGSDADLLTVLETNGKLVLRKNDGKETILASQGENFVLQDPSGKPQEVRFQHDPTGASSTIALGDVTFPRRKVGPENGQVFRITPARPIEDLRKEALATSPPHEEGTFRSPDLVELPPLNPAIHLDIRYATSNDFLGTPVYTQARAFLQRPAAEALLHALQRLKPFGYGLLIHDAYRPWYVTKIFWDATPPEGKIFVADPSEGSRHNRGCAVDLTLYDLQTGKPIEMPGTYDEMSPRSFPDYPGGTSLQRWHRNLLRWAMESEGFTVYEHEWWHFDFKDWHAYPILNVPFERLQFSQKMQAP
jgi:D-alanyl-D-alanine dipeptidase